jgi:hypothetical protein
VTFRFGRDNSRRRGKTLFLLACLPAELPAERIAAIGGCVAIALVISVGIAKRGVARLGIVSAVRER